MKKLIVIIILFALGSIAYPQEETLLEGGIESGGFGGPVVKFTQIKKEFGVLVGGYGGWLINHTFMIGGGGYGLVNKIRADEEAQTVYQLYSGRPINIEMGYGGVVLEYIDNSNALVHFAFNTLIGAGGVTYNERDNDDWDWNDNNNRPTDAFFVVEPELKAELNMTTFLRINIGGSYRFVSGINLIGLKNSDIAGPSANITFKFGKF
jgi:hypothetical protein